MSSERSGTRKQAYPKTVQAGARQVRLRLMVAQDGPAILAFARSLPRHDLLFLRRDITQQAAIDRWTRELDDGTSTTLLALAGEEVVGYAALYREPLHWSSHVAEIRIQVAPDLRGQGLGRLLTQEVFALALEAGVEKIVAQMTVDQDRAIATFESLGFRPEALLRDHVKDKEGQRHDLLVMSHQVEEFARTLDAYGVTESLGG
jgi:ribosomal protein S18 acetylase RimI-like enzyme